MNKSKVCEICNGRIVDWQLDENNTLQKCISCDHIMRDITQSKCNSREHAWGGDGFFDKVRNFLTFKSILKNMKKTDFENVFEIGFGSGWLLKKFCSINRNVSGVDKKTLGVTIEEIVKSNGELFYGNAEDFNIPENRFDLVLAIHLVEHLLEPEKVFKNAYNGLKNGGIFYIMTPSGCSTGLKLFKSAWWNLEDPTHLRFYSHNSISKALKSAGFNTVIVKRSFLDSMTVELNSFIRMFYAPKGNHGVLSGKIIQVIDIILLLPFLLIRLLIPSMRSTIEVIAKKN